MMVYYLGALSTALDSMTFPTSGTSLWWEPSLGSDPTHLATGPKDFKASAHLGLPITSCYTLHFFSEYMQLCKVCTAQKCLLGAHLVSVQQSDLGPNICH